jgi:heme/copper-type cytochrome/quinol oxidase subunit 2
VIEKEVATKERKSKFEKAKPNVGVIILVTIILVLALTVFTFIIYWKCIRTKETSFREAT